MTPSEVDALPENGGGYDQVIGPPTPGKPGRCTVFPVARPAVVLFFSPDGPPAVRDSAGLAWSVGTGSDGKRYKQRCSLFDDVREACQ